VPSPDSFEVKFEVEGHDRRLNRCENIVGGTGFIDPTMEATNITSGGAFLRSKTKSLHSGSVIGCENCMRSLSVLSGNFDRMCLGHSSCTAVRSGRSENDPLITSLQIGLVIGLSIKSV
jgi:hypothetical protein